MTEEVQKKTENLTTPEKPALNLTPQVNMTDAEKARAKKKEQFLEHYEKTLCMIKASCEKVGISRETYYAWLDSDSEFRDKATKILFRISDNIEERYKRFLFKDNNMGLTALMFWLKMRHPDYKATVKVEHEITGGTAEDIMMEFKADLKLHGIKSKLLGAGQPAICGTDDEDNGQKGKDSAVCPEPGAGNILEKKDEKKPMAEAPAERPEQDNRRGPAGGLPDKTD